MIDVQYDIARRQTQRHNDFRFCITNHTCGAHSHQPESRVFVRLVTVLILHAYLCVQACGSVEALLKQIVDLRC
jgi:hypothetical protein